MTDSITPAKAPRAVKPRAKKKIVRVRWSVGREELFLAELARSANVAASIRATGLSDTTVYRRRQQHEAFRARWAAALREGFAKLEEMLLERALNGVEKPVWHGGKQVGTMREYSDRLALALLNAHRATATGVAAVPAVETISDEAVRAELGRRLSEMNIRMGGAG